MSKDPIAFWSYAHADDAHDGGRISALRGRLSGEAQIQIGKTFPIFQDRDHISWGQQWKQRIDDSLDSVTFLIPVITPTFLLRPECRREVEKFLEREKKLGRKDQILPIYYVDCPQLNDDALLEGDELFGILRGRQYFDFRAHRHEPLTSPEMGRLLEKMTKQLVEVVNRSGPEKPIVASSTVDNQNAAATKDGESTSVRPLGPSKMVDPPTHIVDAMHRGHFASISEAISFAKPGDRIVIRRGTYRESLVIDKPLELFGDGELGDVVIESVLGNVFLFQSTMGRLANLTIRQLSTNKYFGVEISQGRLDVDGCDVTSVALSCIAISGGADPRLRHNRIHNSNEAGILFSGSSMGTVEDNDIFENVLAGIEIKSGSNPVIRRNRIHHGKSSGIHVQDGGLGLIEDNEIFANGISGVAIKGASNPTLRHNKIHHQSESGIFVSQKGCGLVEENEIFENRSGVGVSTEGNPFVRGNQIRNSKQVGLFIYEGGLGTFDDNDILENGQAGVRVIEASYPIFTNNRINKNGYEAVWVDQGGKGLFTLNDLRNNKRGAWDIAKDCEAQVVRENNIEK